MNRFHTSNILAILIFGVGFGLVFALSSFLEQNRLTLPEGFEDADVAVQGKRLKGFVLGADGLLADWYWMQSLQYLGDKIENSKAEYINVEDLSSLNPRLLYPYLDNATEFDPHFMPAYSFGATILPAIDKEKAIAFTEKGIAHNPDKFRLYQYLGYIYWKLGRYDEAADVYKRGMKLPDAPPFMKLMAASMTNEGGSRETARAMYQQMYDESEDQQTRSNAEYRLMEIDSIPELNAINAILKAHAEKNGRCANSLHDILPMLASVKLPGGQEFRVNGSRDLVDATGIPYVVDYRNCQAVVNPNRGRPVRQGS
jgi:tetratricopeptide (TPR) repeat protein